MDKSLGYLKKSGIQIRLADGKVHKLVYDLNALEYLQEAFSVVEGFSSVKDLDKIELNNAKNIKILIRAGILHEFEEGKEPTLREVGKLIDVDMVMNFEKYIGEALALSMPERDMEESDSEKK